MVTRARIRSLLLWLFSLYTAASMGFVFFLLCAGGFDNEPEKRAVVRMGFAFAFLWCVVCGGFMYCKRESIVSFVDGLPGRWQTRFVLFATFLALFEEAITTSMTNLAPLFGSDSFHAHITASTNYFYVVCFHSVILFIPMFICWAWMLSRYAFTPNQVFFLYGITGLLAELQGDPGRLLSTYWIVVYGLFVWLPAYLAPADRAAKRPKAWHYLMAVFLPFPSIIPVGLVIGPLKEYLHIPLFPGS